MRNKFLQIAVFLFFCFIFNCVFVVDLSAQSKWTRHTLLGGGGEPAIAIDPNNPAIVYVTTDNGGVVKSTDSGENWFSIMGNLSQRRIVAIKIDPLNSQVVYITTRGIDENPAHGELYRTRNGGKSWELVYGAAGWSGYTKEGKKVFGVLVQGRAPNQTIVIPPGYDTDGDNISDIIYVGGGDGTSSDKYPEYTDWRAGVWKSVDEGVTFKQMGLMDKNVYSLRLDPKNKETVYVSAGDRLYKSRDGGNTWTQLTNGLGSALVRDIQIASNGTTIYAGTSGKGIYKSTDAGNSFFSINNYNNLSSAVIIPVLIDRNNASGEIVYIGVDSVEQLQLPHRILKTINGGSSWTLENIEVISGHPWFYRVDRLLCIEQAINGNLFMTNWRGIYRYDAAANLWKIKSAGLGNIAVMALAFAPGSSSTVYLGMGDSDGPWKSNDRGLTWLPLKGPKSADGVKTTRVHRFAISPTNPKTIYVAGRNPNRDLFSAVNRTTDGGVTWINIARETNGLPFSGSDPYWQWQANGLVVTGYNPNIVYAALKMENKQHGIYKTSDGGNHWILVKSGINTPVDMAITLTNPETVVCLADGGAVYIGRDSSWVKKQLPTGSSGSMNSYAVDIFSSNPSYILAGNINGAYLTKDGGNTWKQVLSLEYIKSTAEYREMVMSDFGRTQYMPNIKAVKFSPNDANILYLGHEPSRSYMGIGLFKSSDGGNSWINLANEGLQFRSVVAMDVAFDGNIAAGHQEVHYYHATSNAGPSPTPVIEHPLSTPTLTPTIPASFCKTCGSSLLQFSSGNANCDSGIDILDFYLWRDVYLKLQDGKSVTEAEKAAVDFDCQRGNTVHTIDLVDFSVWFGSYESGSR